MCWTHIPFASPDPLCPSGQRRVRQHGRYSELGLPPSGLGGSPAIQSELNLVMAVRANRALGAGQRGIRTAPGARPYPTINPFPVIPKTLACHSTEGDAWSGGRAPRLACHLPRAVLRAGRPQPSEMGKKRAPDTSGARLFSFIRGAPRVRSAPPRTNLPDPLPGPVITCHPVMGSSLLDSSGTSQRHLSRRFRMPHHHTPGYTNPRPAGEAGSCLP